MRIVFSVNNRKTKTGNFHLNQVLVVLNPSNAESTFVQSTQMQRFLKTIKTMSCWYSLESSRRALSDEYPFARVSVIFRIFASFCIGQISHQQLKG